MRFSVEFTRAFLILLWYALPVLGGIALLITLCGLLLARLEGISYEMGIYFAWVTGTTIGYGDLLPTTSASRFLALFIALLGVPLNGLIAGVAIVAAKLSIDKHRSLREMVLSAEERLDRKFLDKVP